jgi:hypothetical protein
MKGKGIPYQEYKVIRADLNSAFAEFKSCPSSINWDRLVTATFVYKQSWRS